MCRMFEMILGVWGLRQTRAGFPMSLFLSRITCQEYIEKHLVTRDPYIKAGIQKMTG
jgi:hypothetical protein